MVRSIFLAPVLILAFGCSAATQNKSEPDPDFNRPARSQMRLDEQAAEVRTAPRCMSPANEEYTCEDNIVGVVNSGSDISKFDGYHVIEFVKDDNGNTLAHVADTCQHYFCAVDISPPSDTQCKQPKVRTIGCCLAHTIKKMDDSSK